MTCTKYSNIKSSGIKYEENVKNIVAITGTYPKREQDPKL